MKVCDNTNDLAVLGILVSSNYGHKYLHISLSFIFNPLYANSLYKHTADLNLLGDITLFNMQMTLITMDLFKYSISMICEG